MASPNLILSYLSLNTHSPRLVGDEEHVLTDRGVYKDTPDIDHIPRSFDCRVPKTPSIPKDSPLPANPIQ